MQMQHRHHALLSLGFPLAPHLSPQVPIPHTQHVCQDRACETTAASPVCLFAAFDGWEEGTWVQEISTSQIRLINPQLKLLAEESC